MRYAVIRTTGRADTSGTDLFRQGWPGNEPASGFGVVEQNGAAFIEGQEEGFVGRGGWQMNENGVYVVSGIIGVTLHIPNAGSTPIHASLTREIGVSSGGIGV